MTLIFLHNKNYKIKPKIKNQYKKINSKVVLKIRQNLVIKTLVKAFNYLTEAI